MSAAQEWTVGINAANLMRFLWSIIDWGESRGRDGIRFINL